MTFVMVFSFAAVAGKNDAKAAEQNRITNVASVAENAVEVSTWDELAKNLIDGNSVILTADITAKGGDVALGSTYLGAEYNKDQYGDVEVDDPNNPGAKYNRHYVVVGAYASGDTEIILDLNGHTLTLNQTYFVVDKGKTFTINGRGSKDTGGYFLH